MHMVKNAEQAVPKSREEILEAVRASIEKNPKFKEAFEVFKSRNRGRSVTSVRRLHRVLTYEEQREWTVGEVQKLFEILQSVGAGFIEYGGDTPVFNWKYHLKDFALEVLGKKPAVRKRKDGSVISSRDGLRGVTPPRKTLPKLSEGLEPVTDDGRRLIALLRNFLGTVNVPAMMSNLNPDDCRKLTEILLILNKRS